MYFFFVVVVGLPSRVDIASRLFAEDEDAEVFYDGVVASFSLRELSKRLWSPFK